MMPTPYAWPACEPSAMTIPVLPPPWPELAEILEPQEYAAQWAQVRPAFLAWLRGQRIPEDAAETLAATYLPLCAWIARQMNGPVLTLGISGAQGSGKSTLSEGLALLLGAVQGYRVARFSIDDLYKTRAERARMAEAIHPLFATRGVPGTHDVDLGRATLHALKSAAPGSATRLPSFDKGRDDRRPKAEWPIFQGRPDIILFEGWCVGTVAQPEADLREPVNALERDEDPAGTWRREVNRQIQGAYAGLCGELDRLIMLRVPGMDAVLEWRGAQERKLAEARHGEAGFQAMDAATLSRFVMHYERLTRHNLAEMPSRADMVLHLDARQRCVRIQVNHRTS